MGRRGLGGLTSTLTVSVAIAVCTYLPVSPEGASPMELGDPIGAGHVTATAIEKRGLDRVTVELRAVDGEAIRIVITRATPFFFGDAAGVQRISSTEDVLVPVAPGERSRVVVSAACFDMRPAPPSEGAISQEGIERLADSPVARIVTTFGFQSAGSRIRQFAIRTLMAQAERHGEYEGMSVGGDVARILEEEGISLEPPVLFYETADLVHMLSPEQFAAAEYLRSRGSRIEGPAELCMLSTGGGATRGERLWWRCGESRLLRGCHSNAIPQCSRHIRKCPRCSPSSRKAE